MFTGLVADVGTLVSVSGDDRLKRMRIACGFDADAIPLGASIACSGPCLTVVGKGAGCAGVWFDVDVAAETIACTDVASWQPGRRLNLERSLRIGDELGGHLVTGHVDGIAEIIGRQEVTADSEWGPTARFDLRAPSRLKRFIAPKGSVALDGTSLTVNTVDDDAFSVLIIPHTLAVTTWGERRQGDCVNLEIDLMSRYAARLVEAGSGAGVEHGPERS